MEMGAHIVKKLKGSGTIFLILTPIHFLAIQWMRKQWE
jgi:superfamily II DNA or RNA helicase